MKTIKAQDLWDKFSVREETEDHYGRKGRGITLVYFNPKFKDKEYLKKIEVIKSIMEDNKDLDILFSQILLLTCHNEDIKKKLIDYTKKRYIRYKEIESE